ncbi:MAG: glycogen-binding domain-containing protein [Bacteroidales bacterium]|nr:glycogen-binding domain-containing protein [Bacteroidales bacterium]
MNKLLKYFVLIIALCYTNLIWGQTEPEKAGKMIDGRFVLNINLNWNNEERARFAELYDLDSLIVSAIFNEQMDFINDSTEWIVRTVRKGQLELSKDFGKDSDAHLEYILFSGQRDHAKPPPPVSIPANYGRNSFTSAEVFNYHDGLACFLLPDQNKARSVFLSGSFNQWSTMQLPMQKTEKGWEVCLQLPAGKHYYKFIVDGNWMYDPNNKLKEKDGHRSYNSVVYCYNHVFTLANESNARRVTVAGSFNSWNQRELDMKRTPAGWELPLYLREGTHAYKFIVDGRWINDPANPYVRPDGSGNYNSFLGIGDTLVFKLKNYPEAGSVILTGSFNAWNTGELLMEKKAGIWQLPYVLAAGNYEYKLIVDGRWIADPLNPFTTGEGDYVNSFVAFKPNHVFKLQGFTDANHVIVAGSFNGWHTKQYRMVFRDGEWVFPVNLAYGRHSYKFIVDGEWILDPANPLWEENEFGGGNSVLWIEQ